MQDFLSISNGGITLMLGVVTLVGLFLGSQAIPSITNWIKGVLKAIMYPFTGTSRAIEILSSQHAELNKKISYIVEQMNPNGGTSLRDGLNRIEHTQASIAARLEVVMTFTNPMYQTDTEGKTVWVSASYASKVKKPVESLLGWGWISVIHPDDLHRIRETWNLCIQDERDFQETFRVISSEGQIFKILSTAHPIKVNGKITGWVGAWQDVT